MEGTPRHKDDNTSRTSSSSEDGLDSLIGSNVAEVARRRRLFTEWEKEEAGSRGRRRWRVASVSVAAAVVALVAVGAWLWRGDAPAPAGGEVWRGGDPVWTAVEQARSRHDWAKVKSLADSVMPLWQDELMRKPATSPEADYERKSLELQLDSMANVGREAALRLNIKTP